MPVYADAYPSRLDGVESAVPILSSANSSPPGTDLLDPSSSSSPSTTTSTLASQRPPPMAPRPTTTLQLLWQTKKTRWVALLFVVCMTVGTLALVLPKLIMTATTATKTTTTSDDDLLAVYKERYSLFRTLLAPHAAPGVLALPRAPQARALQWLVFADRSIPTNAPVVTQQRLLQRYALLTLYYTCVGDYWKGVFEGQPLWVEQGNVHECDFTAVTCDNNGRIVAVTAPEAGWVGQLPAEVGLWSHLTSLDLRQNELQGTIPLGLFQGLTNLEHLDLSDNGFLSTIPSHVGRLTKLKSFFVQNNQFSGSLPTDLALLTDLQFFHLSRNDFTGPVLHALDAWSGLVELRLEGTRITGSLPESIVQLSNTLQVLYPSSRFAGTIPSGISQLTNLQNLVLEGNGLSGTFPSEIHKLTQLSSLAFINLSGLVGSLPTGIGMLTDLVEFVLQGTSVTGTVPTELGSLTQLFVLGLFQNDMTGTIPTEIGDIPTLRVVFLNDENLTGDIPPGLCRPSVNLEFTCNFDCACCASDACIKL